MKKVILLLIAVCFIAGCGTVRFGTYMGTKILPNYQISAERIKLMAPQFKASWGPVSGFIQGNVYYEQKMPLIVQNIIKKLDAIYIKAQTDIWTEREQGEMCSLVLQLEYEWSKYVYDEYGDTIFGLIKQIAG
jgi:hypothetical protein